MCSGRLGSGSGTINLLQSYRIPASAPLGTIYEDPACQPAWLLCRRKHGDRYARNRHPPLWHADLCVSRDRPQQACGRAVRRAGGGIRKYHRGSAGGGRLTLLGPWRGPGSQTCGGRAAAAGYRRYLPACHQGAPRGNQVCEGGLPDHADWPRRPRRGDRHDGTGARGLYAGRDGRDGRYASLWPRRSARVSHADDTFSRRCIADHQPIEGTVSADRWPPQG